MADDFAPIRHTGIGSWPGTDFAEALKINFAESADLPYLPELPSRGVGAGLIGRGVAVLSDLSFDLQPAGWRMTGAPGRDQLRARATLRDDLDQLEEAVQDYAGLFKVAIAGPWTLAASIERPRGDRSLADHGARREIAESLTEGITQLLADLGRRLPQLDLIIQLDEPLLPAVLAGHVPTASGFSSHRKVDLPEVREALAAVAKAIQDPEPVERPETDPYKGPEPVEGLSNPGSAATFPKSWLHSCAADVPVKLIKEAGIGGAVLDLDQLNTADWDRIGQAMSDGLWFGAGALSTASGSAIDRQWSADTIAQRVLRSVRELGLEPDVAGRMIITPGCGLARFDRRSAVNALRAVAKAADIVTDQLAD